MAMMLGWFSAAASRALLQPPSPFLVARQRLRKNLQRHLTANTRIEVAVNLAHLESGVLPVSLHRHIPFVSLGESTPGRMLAQPVASC